MKKEIKFNSLYSSNNYTKNLEKLFADYKLFREKYFSQACIDLLQAPYSSSEILLTHSATGALEIIALVLDIQEGDEIILPSFTFVSTANAFALRGAKLVFVDIEQETFGLDPKKIEAHITSKTKAIIGVHYAGNACKIKEIKAITSKHNIPLIEDAAMAFGSVLDGQALGTFGDFAVISFDITKHISATQGGCLLLNNPTYSEKANNSYHIGTNRTAFDNGDVPYYEWVGLGSKYQMPETNAAILLEQLNQKVSILQSLKEKSKQYYENLEAVIQAKQIQIAPNFDVSENFHAFYLLLQDEKQRNQLSTFLKDNGIEALFHYIPLHDSQYAKSNKLSSNLKNTSSVSERLLRLPMHTQLTKQDIDFICAKIKTFLSA